MGDRLKRALKLIEEAEKLVLEEFNETEPGDRVYEGRAFDALATAKANVQHAIRA